MHSSRMRTTRSSSRHGGVSTPPPGAGIPQEQAPLQEQATLRGRHPPRSRNLPGQIPLNFPLGVGLDQIPLNFPLGCGPGPDSLNFLLGCGPGDPPGQIPLNFPLGCGPGNLQGMVGYHPPGVLLQGMLGYHLQCMLG